MQEEEHLSLTELGDLIDRDLVALNRAAGRFRERVRENIELADKISFSREALWDVKLSSLVPFPTHMLKNGAPIRHLQELLGHESLEVTQLYTRVTINDLKKIHIKYHPGESLFVLLFALIGFCNLL